MIETSECILRDLSRVVYAVEANTFESHMLWEKNHKRIKMTGYDDKCGAHGYGVHLGTLDDMPIMLSITFYEIDGYGVMFYHPTSMVVDWRKIEEYIKVNLPGIPTTDAGNFHRCVHAIQAKSSLMKS